MINDGASMHPSMEGICDTHMHVYGPAGRFPAEKLIDGATFEDYLALREKLGISRTVYVQPSAYGRDHGCLLDALERDPENARGIAIAGTETAYTDLRKLDDAGVRGVRFLSFSDSCLSLPELEDVAQHIAQLGWHVIVQTTAAELADIERRLINLPCTVVIDHMGRIPATGGTDHPAFQSLLRLLDHEHCWLKLSGPYYLSADFDTDVAGPDRVQKLLEIAADRLLWGSNWPHPSLAAGEKPDDIAMMALVQSWCGDDWPKIAVKNPARLYGF
jgi:predicted TIM-barrel fold metal-dependent hydrolase